MGATIHDRIGAILRHDDVAGAPLLHMPHSGYERLSMGGTTVIADTGAPPPSEVSSRAHAGCLSFEMSSGRHNFIVNSGVDTFGDFEFRPLARATAAHSTAVINDTSSARFNTSQGVNALLGAPLTGGPRQVRCERRDDHERQAFIAAHDGYYARFGIHHERSVALSEGGSLLSGIDRFVVTGDKSKDGDLVAVRFHVHPDIVVEEDQHEWFALQGPGTDRWTFTATSVEPVIEDSIFFAGLSGPRRTKQIVLAFQLAELQEVRWQFRRVAISGSEAV
jgi:uncharacterized heparinase superfamily protein